MMIKPLLASLTLLFLAIACTQTISEQPPKQIVHTFAECVQAGYPILEANPIQCRTPAGQTFTEQATTPQPESCKDQCGNGQCQEVVCMAIGCPCAESAQTCPQDCASPNPNCPSQPIPLCLAGSNLIKELSKNGCLIYACKPQKVCPLIAKICPDGTAVGQVGPNCEFAPCPAPSRCGNDICEEGEASYCPPCVHTPPYCRIACRAGTCPQDCVSTEDGDSKSCSAIYQPVCGLVHVQCIRAPCPPQYQTFSNRCELGKNPLAQFVHEGTCEEQSPKCGNDLCEEGEANSPGGCSPNADPGCLGPPAHLGSCPQDCPS